jgi:hypothetical protein
MLGSGTRKELLGVEKKNRALGVGRSFGGGKKERGSGVETSNGEGGKKTTNSLRA